MPKYMLTGKNAGGRAVTEVVPAPTADAAVDRFKARGFTDVVLHSDEVIGHLFNPELVGEHLSAKDYLALGRVSRAGFVWRVIARMYRQQWWLFLVVVALFVGRRVLDAPWGVIDYVAVLFLFSPVIIVVLSELFSPSRRFERAMAYGSWARWEEMLAALPACRAMVPAPQYAFFEAKALAGLGRLDEALERVRPFADDRNTPAWLYWGQLADVFISAKMPDRVIECGQKALELAPDNVTVLLDLAMALLRYRRDAAAARPLLERARQHAISDLVAPFLVMAEGILALEERRPERARPLLEESLRLAIPLRFTTSLMGSAIDRIHTYLCLACAAGGDLPAAEGHFRTAEPRLRAFAADDLLERCEAALGERA